MINLYLNIFRRYHKAYAAKASWWLLFAILEIPIYFFMIMCFEKLSTHTNPIRNALWVMGLGALSFLIRIIFEMKLLQCAMVTPTKDLQVGIFRHFMNIPPQNYTEVPSGRLTNVLFSQITAGWFMQGFIKSIYYIFRIITLFSIMATISWPLATLSTLPVLLLVLLGRSMGKSFINFNAATTEASARLESFITESLHGILTIKLFNAEKLHVKKIKELTQRHTKYWLKSDFLGEGVNCASVSLPQLTIPLFLVAGGYYIGQGDISAAQFVSMYVVLNLLNSTITEVGILLGYALNFSAQMQIIIDFLSLPQETEYTFSPEQRGFALTETTFSFNSDTIFENLSLTIQPAEKLALVGASGAGKSTLFDLLRGVQFCDTGSVMIGGESITPETAAAARKQIASVSQTGYLFEADLHFNLTCGQKKTESEIQAVLTIVGLKDFVDGLPDKLETKLGPNGFTVSGGEKSRICLARALLLDRPILLLDEITANIDSICEKEILENIIHKMKEKTVIVSSHRLSSIRNFPRIIYLESGKISGDGDSQTLLKTSRSYRQLFGKQIY